MLTLFRASRRLLFLANYAQVVLAGWIVLLIMAFTSYGVFTRYVLNRPDAWSFPVSAYLLCFVVFLGISHTLQRGVHVQVDFFLGIMPEPIAALLRLLRDLVSGAFILLFTWQVWVMFQQSYSRWRIDETTLAWPIAVVQWIIPLGGAFLLLTHLALVVSRLVGDSIETEGEA